MTTPTLVRRYEQTRRRHPLIAGESLEDAIETERRLLEQSPHLRIEKTGRGRFRLLVARPVLLERDG